MKKLFAIRGAICTKNSSEEITNSVIKMCNEIFEKNNIKSKDLVSIQFTVTDDLTVLNPASALRKGGASIDVSSVALFCSQEAIIKGGMQGVIRVMILSYLKKNSKIKNVYLDGAEALRPDRK